MKKWILLSLLVTPLAFAGGGMRARQDNCKMLVEKISGVARYDASCTQGDITQYSTVAPNKQVDLNYVGLSLSFETRDTNQVQTLFKLLVKPTREEDQQISNFSIACRPDAIEVSYVSNSSGQKIEQSISMFENHNLLLKNKSTGGVVNQDINCSLQPSF